MTPRDRRVATTIAGALLAIAYAANPPASKFAIVDQVGFLDTLRRMKASTGFYAAYADSFAALGADVGSIRGYRFPTMFLIWRWFPEGWLYPIFVAIVVVLSSVFAMWITDHTWPVLPMAGYLLYASRGNFEGWLLLEFWAVPWIFLAIASRRQGRQPLAAGAATLAFFVRETAVVMMMGGALDSLRRRRSLRPWLIAGGVAAIGLSVHAIVARSFSASSGGEARFWGSSDGVRSVVELAGFRLPIVLALAVWMTAWLQAVRRGEAWFLGPLFALPLVGLVADRPYWGAMVTPVLVLLTADAVGDVVNRRHRRVGARAGTAHPRPSTAPPGR